MAEVRIERIEISGFGGGDEPGSQLLGRPVIADQRVDGNALTGQSLADSLRLVSQEIVAGDQGVGGRDERLRQKGVNCSPDFRGGLHQPTSRQMREIKLSALPGDRQQTYVGVVVITQEVAPGQRLGDDRSTGRCGVFAFVGKQGLIRDAAVRDDWIPAYARWPRQWRGRRETGHSLRSDRSG
jgi:hypothetical protein